ncbi:hypothetical protein V8C43DRAFT_296214, partial [Trichoderma afarasin]
MPTYTVGESLTCWQPTLLQKGMVWSILTLVARLLVLSLLLVHGLPGCYRGVTFIDDLAGSKTLDGRLGLPGSARRVSELVS